jgi:hypothetical protein
MVVDKKSTSPVLHDEGEIDRFFMTWVATIEVAEFFYTVVSDTGTGIIISHQAMPSLINPST